MQVTRTARRTIVDDDEPSGESDVANIATGPASQADRSVMDLQLVASTASIAPGRHWVADQARLAGVDAVHLPLLALLSSELITNAVMHGPRLGTIAVRVRRSGGDLRVEVDDGSPDPPRLRGSDPPSSGGRGLVLVESLAARWGCVARGAEGKTVWFDLVLAP